MGFIFRKCARQRAVPIIKATGEKAAALKRLRAFLDAEEPQTVEFLVSLWDEQQSAITYKDLREAVLSGGMSEKQLAQWKIDYSKFVTEKLAPQWEKAMLEAAEELKQQYPYFLYNPQNALAQEFIRQRGAFFVKNIIQEQEKALQAATLHALNLNNAMTADDLSRLLRPMIGLTRPQAIANTNHYNAVYRSGLKAGAGEKAATKKARESTVRYAHRQERYRAITIARTELATAYNQGGYGATLDAQAQGYIGYCKKTWLTADDERVCPECGGLDGESINMDAKFSNGVDLPPAHPNCRCGVIFEEISPPLLTNSADSSIMESGGGNIMNVTGVNGSEQAFDWIDELDEEQKIKFFGGKTKAALYDAGLLNREDYFKPLKEIDLSGIMIPDKTAMNHSIVGDYKLPSKGRPGGRLNGGGHTESAMKEMDKLGIAYNIVRTENNGVIFGNVPDHDKSFKRTGDKQTWFPKSWTEHDIRVAGIYVSNKGNIPASAQYAREAVYKNVNVRVEIDLENSSVKSINPSYDQP